MCQQKQRLVFGIFAYANQLARFFSRRYVGKSFWNLHQWDLQMMCPLNPTPSDAVSSSYLYSYSIMAGAKRKILLYVLSVILID